MNATTQNTALAHHKRATTETPCAHCGGHEQSEHETLRLVERLIDGIPVPDYFCAACRPAIFASNRRQASKANARRRRAEQAAHQQRINDRYAAAAARAQLDSMFGCRALPIFNKGE